MKGKFIKISLLVILVTIVAVLIDYGLKYARIATSYEAKITCSCHFLSERDVQDIKKNDLYAVSFVQLETDDKLKEVNASVWGLAPATAIYREGFGCTLVNGTTAGQLRKEVFPYKRNPANHTFNTASVSEYFDSVRFTEVVNKAFHDSSGKLQTRAVVIIKDGKLVYEKYAVGYDEQTRLTGWSMTKSVTNAMTGILVKRGELAVNDPAPVPQWRNDERKNITLDHMLRMSTGLKFEEDYSKPSDATRMLFSSYSGGQYAIRSELKEPPGSKFYYSSGTTNAIQEIIRSRFSSLADYHAFPYRELFDKTGMASAVLEPDPSGTFVGSSFMYATARDWARFGLLFLQDGQWNGERILPDGWAKYSSRETEGSGGKYAAHFWINHQLEDFPADGYYASGFEGQYINILPASKMVIVRLGCHRGGVKFDNAKFVSDLVSVSK